MSLMAICPKCGVENSPMNAECDVCKASLGAALVENSGRLGPAAEKAWTYVWVGMAITVGMLLPCWLLGLGALSIIMALFYGPLIASFMARENQVYHAALGGVLGFLAMLVLQLALEWQSTRILLAGLFHQRGTYDPSDTSALAALAIGIPVLFLAILPVSLTGASVGEHLCQWRRKRFENLVTPVAAEAMTEDQIARTKL